MDGVKFRSERPYFNIYHQLLLQEVPKHITQISM
jgi:hypothetical protein